MRKSLAIIEGRHVKKYHLGSTCRPMTVVRQHLFRTDDDLFWNDRSSSESIVIYKLESTQPYGDGTQLDPEITMGLIDIARTNRKQNVGYLGRLANIKPMTLIYAAIALVIVLSLTGVVK